MCFCVNFAKFLRAPILNSIFFKKGVPKNFAKFTGKQLCQSLFFNKVAGVRTATLLKMRLWHRCFPVSFVTFLRKPLLQNTCGQQLQMVIISRPNMIIHFSPLVSSFMLCDISGDLISRYFLLCRFFSSITDI